MIRFMIRKRTKILLLFAIAVVFAIVILLAGKGGARVYAAKFNAGDTVQVINVGAGGLFVRSPQACSDPLSTKRFDGDIGVIQGASDTCDGFTRWKVRWNDGIEGWSAEDWLHKVAPLGTSEQPQLRAPWLGTAKITQGNWGSSHNDFGIWDNIYAIDVALNVGTQVIAPADGIITYVDDNPDGLGGIELAIEHTGPTGKKFTTVYLHLSEILKRLNDKVYQGDVVAKSGNTSTNSIGAHLHFHIWSGSASRDSHTIPIERLVLKRVGVDAGFREYDARKGELNNTAVANAFFESNNSLSRRPVITGDLNITTENPPYLVGQTLTAHFTMRNEGSGPITFERLLVGGRLDGVADCSNTGGDCSDFTPTVTNHTLAPNGEISYVGTFTPSRSGEYDFRVFYCLALCDDSNNADWHWDDIPNNPSKFITVQDPIPVEFSLQVSVSGNGTVSGAGIDCPTDCSQVHSADTQVSLLALPDTGYQFDRWGGDCSGQGVTCFLTMNSNKSATAFFKSEPVITECHTLTINNSAGGSISLAPSADCPDDPSRYRASTSVELTANHASGFAFDRWEGDCAGQGATCTLTMSSDRSATAFFSEIQTCPTTLTLGNTTWSSNKVFVASNTISAGPDFTVESGGVVTFQAGTEIRLKPGFTARSGSEFRAEIVSNPC